ncbi:MAG: hypothetical protein KAZ71_07290 [Bacteroidia bacterium]|nr:hypothetical protein [Bacteroidia bacterium]
MEPTFRCGTRKSIDELSKELNIPYDTSMQDWSYTEGKPEDIEKYIAHYNSTTDDDNKFVLMELIIQATDDQTEKPSFHKYWDIVKNILQKDFTIHEYTVYYWSCFDTQNIDDCWRISENMRELWNSNRTRKTTNR